MFTPYIPLPVKTKQPKGQIVNTIKYSQPLAQSKIFTAPNLTSSCRSANSQQNPLNWSYYSFQQKIEMPKRQNSFSTTRSRKQENQHNDDQDKKKSYQILIKQSLRRSFTTRNKNKSAADVRNTIRHQSSRKLSQNLVGKNRQDILDYLNELEGKKCVINKNSKPKISSSIQNRTQKSKSLQAKPCIKKRKQLKIQSDDQFRQTILSEVMNQPVVAIGMAAKKQNPPICQKNQPNHSSGNKIAISTTQCLIFTEPTSNKSGTAGLYVQSQANFVRAKKKSKVLYKKVANFLKEQQELQPKVIEPRIFEFKNSIKKNLSLQISNSQNLSETLKQAKKQKNIPLKKQQNIRIEGWQTNAGWELEANF